MILNKNNNSFPLNKNSLKEKKEILNGYESKKYLNKQYTSKSKRHLKTRDKSSKRRTVKKFKEDHREGMVDVPESDKSYTLTESLVDKYCKTPELTFSSIMNDKLQQLDDEWIII